MLLNIAALRAFFMSVINARLLRCLEGIVLMHTHNRIILERLPKVLKIRGCGKAKHYNDINNGLWVTPVKLGERYSVYPSNETDRLIAAQISGQSEKQIRELVIELHAARTKYTTEACEALDDNAALIVYAEKRV
jgi:prophage regulatory protein